MKPKNTPTFTFRSEEVFNGAVHYLNLTLILSLFKYDFYWYIYKFIYMY